MEVFLVLWFVGAVVVAILAANRNKSAIAWFILSCIFSPFLTGLIVLAIFDKPR